MAFSDKLLTGVTLTKENFKTPPRELGILPFWFWNGELDPKEMEWQMREYHSKGIPGIFIHGRFGLKVAYVSDEWFERVKFAVAKAKEIGIDTWVYDEMNWPSGTAERQVLKKYPHLTQRYLELVALNVDGPLFTFLEATDNRYVNTGNSHPVAAFGCTEEEYQNGIKNLIDLTRNLSFEKVIPWEAPPGKWRLLYFLEKEVPYYIDTLDPESTEKFIEITHERYKAAVGKDFGTIVPGFYTDEPAMHYYHVGIDNYVVPWSKQMFKIFRERRGYDLRPYLPALYASMGEKTAQVRYDFWRTLTEQYAETYYKRLRDWCEANGVLFTGHLLFEEWLRLQARCEGNLFKYLRHMHIIGVDHLYPKIGTASEPDQHVAMKIGSSAAHHFGSTRVLCESMGGTYWDCTLERMKWMANWEYVLGVNLFNNHGYHYSIEGERKRDWPPSQFYHHTWWKYYDQFTSYAARLSHILSGGRHVAKVLVLYPLSSIWTNYVPQKRTDVGNVIEFDFNYLTDTLLRLHYDFDYVDEDVLAETKIEHGKIKIRDEEYSIFILPPVTHVKRSTFEAMQKFLESGGNIIADTLLPMEFLETEKNNAVKEVKKLFGTSPKKLLSSFQNGGSAKTRIRHRNTTANAFVIEGDAGAGSMPGYHQPDFDDATWLNVTNGAWEMQLPQERDNATYPVTLWYRTAFEIAALPPNTRVLIDGFSGSEYQLFVNGQAVQDKGKRSKIDAEIKEVDIQPYVQVGGNVVAVKLVVNRRTDGILDLLKIVGDFALEKSVDGFKIVEQKHAIKVGDWTKQGYPFYSGTGVYRTEIEVPAKYIGGKLFLEVDCGDDVFAVSINGSPSRVLPWHPYRVDVTDLAKAGTNTVELKVTNTLVNLLEAVQKSSGIFSAPRLVHEHKYTLQLAG